MSTCRTSILDGVSVDALRIRLGAMQQAYLELTTGGKLEVATYAQGDGTRSVTYTRANVSDLTQAILAVQTQIDSLSGTNMHRRRPLRPFF